MKTTSWIWIGCLAVGVANAGQPACAGVQPGIAAALLAAAATGQTEDETSDETRRRCLEMLDRARRALNDGDLSGAESWLKKAEALKVSFHRAALGDTPAKVRKDLEQAQTASQKERGTNERRSTASQEERVACDALLVEARKALATGDVRRAQSLADKAERMDVSYERDADSPAKVSASIARWTELESVASRDKKRGDYARKQAQSLVEQAEALASWGEYDEAERLCDDAERLDARFNPFEASPATIKERIATARRGAGRRAERLPAADRQAEAKDRAVALVRQAREALEAGDLKKAESLANEADSLGVPDDAFDPRDDRHWRVLRDVQRRRDRSAVQAGGDDDDRARFAGTRALYEPDRDETRNEQAGNESEEEVASLTEGMDLYLQGEEALRAGDREEASRLFSEAYGRRNELDAATRQRLQDRLSNLGVSVRDVRPAGGQESSESDNPPDANEESIGRQITSELTRQESAARRVQESDPKAALQILQSARADLERSELDDNQKAILLRRVDRGIRELESYIAANKPQIDLAEQNARTLDAIDRERQMKLDIQQRLANLVEEYNQLIDQERFAEAEVLAKQAYELAPEEPVAVQLRTQSKVMRRLQLNSEIQSRKEEGYVDAMRSVEESSEAFDDGEPYRMPSIRDWESLTNNRKRFLDSDESRLTPREIEIQKLLRTPVAAQYDNAPLSMVVHELCKLAGISVHIDEAGLASEGATSETPVTIDIANEIMLKSALSLVLSQHNLAFIVKNEVLQITSKTNAQGEVYKVVYDVGDLVMPIPNFIANGQAGLSGALTDAHGRTSMGGSMGLGGGSLTAIANNGQSRLANIANPNVMAQVESSGLTPVVAAGESPNGPGGAGGAAQADFDSLIELITSTVQPDTWDEAGGAGAISPFEGNLTLVVSNTQSVHEDIAKLLNQLRRLQDLQVTIEVRFITLNDNFFERIGVDFDFDINDNVDRAFNIFGNPIGNSRPTTTLPPNSGGPRNTLDRDLRPNESVTVGLQAPNVFSADLDIPFRQDSFGLAVPQFGGFQPGAGATMGFSILSDLEAYFFMEASQGDRRSNVLQAPKVTLFNGQSASVSDISQSPFVISLIPVVGDFAAAYMPVIVVLNEGSHLTVNAVVSHDRRFVRLTVVPFFSKITDVNTFRFTGEDSTIEESEDEGADDKSKKTKRNKTTSSAGTTVQLPTFSFVSVSTTVSVPDGGTVLLGGIKRLSEGRNEFGVPILNKIPYLNRLFRNVGIGRETQSLMMMVTPRIIIQEEEEANLMQGAPLTP